MSRDRHSAISSGSIEEILHYQDVVKWIMYTNSTN
jgi:hypothetical protein